MYGVVSLLDETHAGLIRGIWAELQDHCGLSGIRITPIPHFSWQIAEAYDRPRLEKALREIAREADPLKVTTTGLGLFTGANPVLYIPLVKDAEMVAFHASLWKAVAPYSINPSSFYAPHTWVPHITLAHGDTNARNLQCAIQRLAFGNHRWEFSVDNLALIGQSNGEIGEEKFRVRFKEGS